jgi:hypothetical protein
LRHSPPLLAHGRQVAHQCPAISPCHLRLTEAPPVLAQVFGASATALYGINLLLNPVPPEQYKLYPEAAGSKKQKKAEPKPAKQQKKRWWRRKGKGKGDVKDAESSDVSDADTGIDSKVSLMALDRTPNSCASASPSACGAQQRGQAGRCGACSSVHCFDRRVCCCAQLDVERSMDSFGSTLSSKSQTPSQSARSDITMGTVIGPELDQVSMCYHVQRCCAVTPPMCRSALQHAMPNCCFFVARLTALCSLQQMYHIRVLIPCYKEELHIVQKTLNAIREAALPAGELKS